MLWGNFSRLTKICSIFFIPVVVFSIFWIGGGSNKKKEVSVLRLNIGNDPLTLDPRKARDMVSLTVCRMLFDGLTRINLKHKPELSLAKEMEVSSDGKMYTFKLRDGVVWSSGKPITAHDFVNSWKKTLDPQFPASQAFVMFGIVNAQLAKAGQVSVEEVGIRTIDDKTLQIELTHPLPYFLELLAMPVFYPVPEGIEENPGVDFINNGPFLLKNWQKGDHIFMNKNPLYWDESRVKLQKMELLMVNETVELSLFEQGKLDWAGSPLSSLPQPAIHHLKKEGKISFAPGCGTIFFRINVEASPLQSPLMRKALGLALRKEELVEHVLQGGQIPANSLLPPSLLEQPKEAVAKSSVKGAQELFRQALAELKMTKEQLPTISLMLTGSERNRLIAQAVQQDWQEILGITVALNIVDRGTFFDTLSKGKHQLAIGDWIGDFNDPMNFLEIFKFKTISTKSNSWESIFYKELLDRALDTQNVFERQKIFLECESILRKEMPIIPLCHHSWVYMVNPQIQDMVFLNLGNLDFKWAYKKEAP